MCLGKAAITIISYAKVKSVCRVAGAKFSGDDKEFELKDMISKKAKFKEMVFREFMRLNSNVVTKELSEMEEVKLSINKGKQRRLKI